MADEVSYTIENDKVIETRKRSLDIALLLQRKNELQNAIVQLQNNLQVLRGELAEIENILKQVKRR